MKQFLLAAAACSALTAGAATAQSAPALPSATSARLDAIFKDIGADAPGCAIGVYRDGKLLAARGYGLANVELRVPITDATVFDIGSVSKQFTAMAAILLAQDGKISLDDDIRRFMPELRDYGSKITVRHLIHHSSGIPDFLNLMFLRGQKERDGISLPEIFDLMARQDALMFAPGTGFSYSNTGYVLLGEIVARASGKSLAAFSDERIFKPLGMANTHVHDDAGRIVPRRAYGYHADEKKGLTVGGSNLEVPGDGAVFTTVGDLQKWDADFDRGAVWTPAVKAEMLRVAHFPNGKPVATGSGTIYAGGVGLGRHRGLDVVRHGGSWAGYVADLVRFPKQRFGVSVLCNVDSADPAARANQIADLFLAAEFTEPPRAPGSDDDMKLPDGAVPISPALLDAIAGRYRSDQIDADYVIRRNGASLVIEAGPRRTPFDFAAMGLPLFQIGGDRIVSPMFQLQLSKSGTRIDGFALEMDGTAPVRFVRKPD
ncbi:class A beta-lactamase-related serine hydrolase [Sphingomonas koreensis]|uniref:serine hydrolase domain-containing protein n=1 Tax=Sphingomonas koreensis TaxID=93064 RepID=UPI00082C76F4|nr:serine hydrolase domain-containing protein [Sphingomonas koreensis]PJI87921.1 CubicO group peptidase (beta-lactamase class C family) [Sphingomonas koreensis]RSU55922.1 class A beta-lactamase-related serine hydrolase [Sphingomonas koreensis]RSU66096.1 class A beta-lactamase-related serine hydrolase [Sphingomonas koreensis]